LTYLNSLYSPARDYSRAAEEKIGESGRDGRTAQSAKNISRPQGQFIFHFPSRKAEACRKRPSSTTALRLRSPFPQGKAGRASRLRPPLAGWRSSRAAGDEGGKLLPRAPHPSASAIRPRCHLLHRRGEGFWLSSLPGFAPHEMGWRSSRAAGDEGGIFHVRRIIHTQGAIHFSLSELGSLSLSEAPLIHRNAGVSVPPRRHSRRGARQAAIAPLIRQLRPFGLAATFSTEGEKAFGWPQLCTVHFPLCTFFAFRREKSARSPVPIILFSDHIVPKIRSPASPRPGTI